MNPSPKPFPIPVVAIGPGSQPETESLQYMRMPSDMHTFARPRGPAIVDAAARAQAAEAVLDLLAQMRARPYGETARPRLDLGPLAADVRAAVCELLGDGEVSVLAGAQRAQETAFAGVWHVLQHDGADEAVADFVEAGAIPSFMRSRAVPASGAAAAPAPDGVMNAPSVLAELLDMAARCQPGDPAHIVNLTLLPMTPADLEYLDTALGRGGVTILSRGYGNCRITATGVPGVWWVQYFNSMDHLILNTLEVVDVPEVALAAREDYADSIGRLEEWLAAQADE